MRAWRFPAVKLLLCYVLGLLLAWVVAGHLSTLYAVAALVVLILAAEARTPPEERRFVWNFATLFIGALLMAVQPVPLKAESRPETPVDCFATISKVETYTDYMWLEVADLHTAKGALFARRARVFVPGHNKLRPGDFVSLLDVVTFAAPTNPGAFDRRLFGYSRYKLPCFRCRKLELVRHTKRFAFAGFVQRLREQTTRAWLALLPGYAGPQRARLLCSMVFGSRLARPDPRLIEAFRASGTLHLLVVSGSQVALLVVLLAWLSRLMVHPLARVAGIVAGVGLVAFYVQLCGVEAPVVRSALGGILALAALLGARASPPENALALAALAMLVANPLGLFDVSLQLTFAAVAGLLLLAPALRLPPLPWGLTSIASATLAAQLAVAPILASLFHTVSVAGLLANVLAVPLAAVITIFTFGLTPLVLAWPALARLLAWPLVWLSDALVRLVVWFAGLHFSNLHVGYVPPLFIVLYYLGLLGWLEYRASRKRRPRKREVRRFGYLPDPT